MSDIISLKIKPETHQHFLEIHQQLNAGTTESLAKPLGDNLADIACEIIDQVFGDIAKMSKSDDHESEKIINQIKNLNIRFEVKESNIITFLINNKFKSPINNHKCFLELYNEEISESLNKYNIHHYILR